MSLTHSSKNLVSIVTPHYRANSDADPEHQQRSHEHQHHRDDSIGDHLRLWVYRCFNMCRVKTTVASGPRGVVDARSGNSNSSHDASRAECQMSPAHPNRQAWPGL